jgi:exonuclease SbcD
MISFIHTADVHFGMENYGKIDAKTGIHSRLLDFAKAFNFCVDYAINNQVDFFLFAGDAYKTTNPSPTQQRLLFKAFLRLQQAKIPVIITVGNHDNPLSFGKANTLDLLQDLPVDGFHVIAKPTSFVLNTKSGPVQIVGMPWPTRNTIAMSEKHYFKTSFELTDYIAQATATIIKHQAQALDPAIPAVLTGHLTVSSGIFSGSEKRAIYGTDPVLLPSQLAIAPFDYVALGHLHRHQNLNSAGYPAVVYSGSIERIDFGERKEDKGFCHVSIHEKGKTSYEFIKTPMRPFIQIDVQINASDQQTEKIVQELKKHCLDQAIVKIVYRLDIDVNDAVDIPTIERACTTAFDLIGIIPIHQPKTREKRVLKNIDSDLPTILESYFAFKPELQNKKDRLIELTLALQEESCQEEID